MRRSGSGWDGKVGAAGCVAEQGMEEDNVAS